MKKEQQAIFQDYFKQFLEHFMNYEGSEEQAIKSAYNQFNDNYFYGDYPDNLQDAFGQFICDNYEPYYSDMKAV